MQVVLRQVFGGGILWCDTLLRHLVLWVGFLGAARAAGQHPHDGAPLGTGLANLRERLRLGLGDDACLTLSALRPRGAEALLSWPIQADGRP